MNKSHKLYVSLILLTSTIVFILFQNFSPSETASVPILPSNECPSENGYIITTDPSVKTDGTTDVSEAFRKALANTKIRTICLPAGNYYFAQRVEMPKNKMINLKGLNNSDISSTVISYKGTTIPFYTNTANGDANKIILFRAQNLTFDGLATEEDFVNNKPSTRALSLVAANDTNSLVEVNNVHFKNMNNLPIWLEGFSHIRILNSRFSKTKDPGILRAKSVIFSHNIVEDTYDNCISISRGNSNVRVTNNQLKNCGGAGIFVGGIAYVGNWNLAPGKSPMSLMVKALDINSMAIGGSCELYSDQDYFRDKMISTYQTVRDSKDSFVIVELTDFKSAKQMGCRFITEMPSQLNGVFSEKWIDGPHFAGENIFIKNNTIDGSSEYGIKLSMAPRGVTVSDNTILNSGRRSNPFHPEQITLSPSFGIVALGWFLSPTVNAHRYAERIFIHNNKIINPTFGGVRIGSNLTGSVRDSAIFNNHLDFTNSSAKIGVLVDGIEAPSTISGISVGLKKESQMPTHNITLSKNEIVFDTRTPDSTILSSRIPANKICSTFKHLDLTNQGAAKCALSLINTNADGKTETSCFIRKTPIINYCSTPTTE